MKTCKRMKFELAFCCYFVSVDRDPPLGPLEVSDSTKKGLRAKQKVTSIVGGMLGQLRQGGEGFNPKISRSYQTKLNLVKYQSD